MNWIETQAMNQFQTRQKQASCDAILDAANYCYSRHGIAATTIDDIAAQAGIGRATIYRNFKCHDDILSHLITREISDLKNRFMAVVARCETAESYLLEGLQFIVTAFPQEPLYNILLSDDAVPITNRLMMSSDVLLEVQVEVLEPLHALLRQAGQLRRGMSLQLLIDWLHRVVASFFMMPGEFLHDPKQFKKYLKLFVIPSLIEPNVN